jgi:IclR family transcriptional regulator, acetate operon repressor
VSTPATAARPSAGGVQSLHRALDLVEIVASAGGHLPIGEIAQASSLPLATIHRLLQTLVQRGYMRRLPNRHYALGFRLVPLGASANAMVGAATESILAELVAALGESANLALLSGDYAEYAAQVPSAHAMRMFTEVGRKVELHCTGVGKAMLAQLDDEHVRGVIARVGLRAHTAQTLTTEAALLENLGCARTLGYTLDEQEQETGVRCVAVPVAVGPPSWMAVSVSGPVTRMTDELVSRAVPLLRSAAARLSTGMSSD